MQTAVCILDVFWMDSKSGITGLKGEKTLKNKQTKICIETCGE